MMGSASPGKGNAFGRERRDARLSCALMLKWGMLAGGMSASLGCGPAAALGGDRLSALAAPGVDFNAGGQLYHSDGPTFRESFRQLAQANAAFVVAREISAVASDPIPLSISLADPKRAQHEFIIIHGLPEDCRISAGFRTKNNWLVSTMDLVDLHIAPPANFVGKFTLRIFLVQGGKQTEEQSVMVNVRPRAAATESVLPVVGTTAAVEVSAPPGAEASPPAKRPSEEEENSTMQRATVYLANADIAGARLLYETLAMKGSARAAFAMGQTFDPEFPAGLKPDIQLARRWYKKAILLGSQDAKLRLAKLDGQ